MLSSGTDSGWGKVQSASKGHTEPTGKAVCLNTIEDEMLDPGINFNSALEVTVIGPNPNTCNLSLQ